MRFPQIVDRALFLIALILALFTWYSISNLKTKVSQKESALSMVAQDHLEKNKRDSEKYAHFPKRNPCASKKEIPINTLSELENEEFPGASVLESTEIEGPELGEKTIVKILNTASKYPVRTEEIFDAKTGQSLAREEMAADHLLVTLPKGTDPDAFCAQFGPQALSMEQISKDPALYKLNLAATSLASLPLAFQTFVTIRSSSYAQGEPDYVIHGPKLHFKNGLYSPIWGLRKISGELNIYTASSKKKSSNSQVIAVIDSGIRYTHQDLKISMWHNPNPTYNDIYGWNAVAGNGDPIDDNGHGTFCAGIIGAAGNNDVGFIGIAPSAQLMACKFLDKYGGGYTSDAIACITYACEHKASVLNCSWSGTSYSELLKDALKKAGEEGIVCVTAAGNNNNNNDETPSYPANFGLDNIISVAASTINDELTDFSNYGMSVHIAAPGEEIYSTYSAADNAYEILDGTSMSTPYVTGAFALLKIQFPNQSYSFLISQLLKASDKPSGLTGKVGFGRLNVTKALTF